MPTVARLATAGRAILFIAEGAHTAAQIALHGSAIAAGAVQCTSLFADYHARIRIVYVEVPEARLRRQNRERPDPVPEGVLERLLDRWEVPDLTEAHEVAVVIQA